MPCRFASSGTVATSRSASRAILALNVASNFLRDLVISVLHRLRQSRTLHTLTFGPISGVHFILPCNSERAFDAGVPSPLHSRRHHERSTGRRRATTRLYRNAPCLGRPPCWSDDYYLLE